ncbi:MAG: CRTAC1 family protein [Planctomycetota bacterium]
MHALLRTIANHASESEYQGDATIRELGDELAALAPDAPESRRGDVLYALGFAELLHGREEDALGHLEEAYALLAAGASRSQRAEHLRALAVASLRRAETENCCQFNNPDSCIVPLQGAAIHTRPNGSQAAVGYLEQLLEVVPVSDPDYHLAQWLLNVAYMTLDRYPDDVPPEHLVAPEHFRSERAFPRFVNVSSELGLDTFSLAGGVVVDDLDNDGDFDVISSSHDVKQELRLFLNDGAGAFQECSQAAGLGGLYGGANLAQGDYDGDGLPDVLVLRGAWLEEEGLHPNSLLRNLGVDDDGQLRFRDVTFAEGLGGPHYPTQAAGWADFDLDGDLDVFVGNESTHTLTAPCQLFRNDGPSSGERGRFLDVALRAGVQNLEFTKGVSWGDYDADGDPDLFVSNFIKDNRLYRNDGDGTFTDVAESLGVNHPRPSYPAWFWDYDNDGELDLFVSYTAHPAGRVAAYYTGASARMPPTWTCGFYRNLGDGSFENVAGKVGLDRPMMPMGCNYGDLNNDGYLDFYLGTGGPDFASIMPNLMYLNEGGERFADVTMAGGFGHLQKGHAIAFADIDLDGDQDVFQQLGGSYEGDRYHDALFRNPGFDNRWLGVKLIGTTSNRSAIGARIEVVIEEPEGQRTVYRHVSSGGSFGASPLEQHVGLGQARRIARLTVTWPGKGREQVFTEVPLDRRLVITEGVPEPVLRPLERQASPASR